MNERMLELVTQARKYAWENETHWSANAERDTLFEQKFAELIVRECLDIASEVRGEPATDTHYVIGYDRACEKMIDGIKEHFGVEE